MLLVVLENGQGIMDPGGVHVLSVDGDTARMTEQEAEARLLKAVFGRQGMDGIFAQGRIDDAAVEMAGVIGHEDGRFRKDFIFAGRV